MRYTRQLDQTEMMDKLIENGLTACPHPYNSKEFIYVPLHNRDNAIPIADFYGWEWFNLGFKPKGYVQKMIKISSKIKTVAVNANKEEESQKVEAKKEEQTEPYVRCVNCED